MSRKATGPVLAVDIGTSSCRAALYDRAGRRVSGSLAQKQYKLELTSEGAAELDPRVLLRSVKACIRQALRKATDPVPAVGVSCFWHSLLPVDRQGAPLGPIYTWADSRCREEAAELRSELREKNYHKQTGCMLRTSFWPAKLRWLAKTRKSVFRQAHRWMSPAEWVQQELCERSRCALGMATGTGLFNPSRNAWQQEILDVCGIEEGQLNPLSNEPSILTPQMARAFPKLAEASWFPAIGDGAASNLGSGATTPGRGAINFGTSAALRVMHSGRAARAPFGLFCYRVDEQRFLIGGAASNAGNIRAWGLKTLNLPATERTIELALAGRPLPEHGIDVLPFLNAERSPNWNEQARSVIVGVTQATTPIDLIQAMVEGTYQRLAMIAALIPDYDGKRPLWMVGGGITHSKSSMQRLANVIGEPLYTSSEPEASLRGAAVYALERTQHSPRLIRARKPLVPDPVATEAYRRQRERLYNLEGLHL